MSLAVAIVPAIILVGLLAVFFAWRREKSQKAHDAYAQSLGHEIVVRLAMDTFEANWGFSWGDASNTHRIRAINEARAVLATALPLVEGYVVDATIDKAYTMFNHNEMYPLTTQRIVSRLRTIKEEGIDL